MGQECMGLTTELCRPSNIVSRALLWCEKSPFAAHKRPAEHSRQSKRQLHFPPSDIIGVGLTGYHDAATAAAAGVLAQTLGHSLVCSVSISDLVGWMANGESDKQTSKLAPNYACAIHGHLGRALCSICPTAALVSLKGTI